MEHRVILHCVTELTLARPRSDDDWVRVWIHYDIVKAGSCTENEKPFEDDVIEAPVNILYQAREYTRERSKFEMATWDSDDDLGVDGGEAMRAVMTVMGMLLPIIHPIEEFVGLSMR